VLGQKSGGEGKILDDGEKIWSSGSEPDNPYEEENDNGNGKEPVSSLELDELGDEHEFRNPEPKPQKRKSRLEQLGIMKPEKRELTEEEQRKADELVAEFSKFSIPEKSEDSWPGLDSRSAF